MKAETYILNKQVPVRGRNLIYLSRAIGTSLRVAAKILHPYFQEHPIIVLTNLPLRSTIHKPDLSGRMAWWVIKLSEFGIQYKPRLTLKGQVMANFLVEVLQQEMEPNSSNWWTLNVDGASRQTGAGLEPRSRK